MLAGCGLSTLDQHETCDLEVELSTLTAEPGDELVLTGGPQTAAYDTRVEVGGLPATVLDVDRNSSCGSCETCRAEAECLVCGTCLGTTLEEVDRIACFGDPFEGTEGVCGECEESVRFVVPDLPAGATTVVVLNGNGSSPPLPLEIVAADAPTDTVDTFDTSPTPDTSVPTGDTATDKGTTTIDTTTVDTSTTADTTDTAGPDTADDTAATAATAATADTVDTADTADTNDTADTGP